MNINLVISDQLGVVVLCSNSDARQGGSSLPSLRTQESSITPVDPPKMLTHNNFYPQICWPPKNFDPQIFVDTNIFLTHKKGWPKTFFDPPKMLNNKNFDPQNLLSPNKFWPSKNVDTQKIPK